MIYSTLWDAFGFVFIASILFFPLLFLAWIFIQGALAWRQVEETQYTLAPVKGADREKLAG